MIKHIPKHKKLPLRKNRRKGHRSSWHAHWAALEKQGYTMPSFTHKYSYLYGM